MLESLNGSVPALRADSHGIQIHGAPAPQYFFNRYRHGRVTCATKTNVFIGRAFVTWTFDRKYPHDCANLCMPSFAITWSQLGSERNKWGLVREMNPGPRTNLLHPDSNRLKIIANGGIGLRFTFTRLVFILPSLLSDFCSNQSLL